MGMRTTLLEDDMVCHDFMSEDKHLLRQ